MTRQQYWLLKTEGDVYPIESLKRDKKTQWSGVRNYRARNYMARDMKKGDLCLFYHSSAKVTGVFGIAQVASLPYADPTQFDKKSHYFDPKSTKDKPIWELVDIAYVRKFTKPVTSDSMRQEKRLSRMMLWRVPRLSIQPVSAVEFRRIVSMAAA